MEMFQTLFQYHLWVPVFLDTAYYPHSRVTVSSMLNALDQWYRTDAQVSRCTGSHTSHTYITPTLSHSTLTNLKHTLSIP